MAQTMLITVIVACALISSVACDDNSLDNQFQDYQALGRDLANLYRAKHDASPLQLNATLNKAAQEFADHLTRTNSFTNKLEPGFIKNLYSIKGKEIDFNEAVDGAIKTWYSSMSKYNWNKPGDVQSLAFSALVWQSTTDIGIGVSTKSLPATSRFRESVRTVVVGAFSPEGNLLGEGGKYFMENVQRSRQ